MKNVRVLFNVIIIGVVLLTVIYLLSKLFFRIKEGISWDDPTCIRLKEKLTPMFDGTIKYTGELEGLEKKNVLSKFNLKASTKSYTIDKKNVYLCLKDKNDPTYYNDNILIYVLLHEIAHVICIEVGHTPLFDRIFAQLLEVAEKLGIYDSTQKMLEDYCPD